MTSEVYLARQKKRNASCVEVLDTVLVQYSEIFLLCLGFMDHVDRASRVVAHVSVLYGCHEPVLNMVVNAGYRNFESRPQQEALSWYVKEVSLSLSGTVACRNLVPMAECLTCS